MNLVNLKKDIRYSIGDINEDKFDNPRILLGLRKAISSINYRFHLNGKIYITKAYNNKEKYVLPNDFYFLQDIKLNNTSLLNTEHYTSVGGGLNTVLLKGIRNIVTEARIVSADPDDTVDIDKIQSIKYQGMVAHLLYDAEYTDFETNAHPIQTLDYGFIEIYYIGTIELSLTDIEINIPENFYDAIHYKVVSDLLSDDSRAEVQEKSARYLAKYNEEVKLISLDTVSLYTGKDLLMDYRRGI